MNRDMAKVIAILRILSSDLEGRKAAVVDELLDELTETYQAGCAALAAPDPEPTLEDAA